MTVDLRDIPPAPRAVRWSTVIWQRWVLLLGGGLLAGFGGLVALLLWVADHGSHVATAENDLDHGGARAAGRVVAVEHAQAWDGTERDVVGYEFTTPDGTDGEGRSWLAPGTVAPGDDATIEYLHDFPNVSRLLGGRVYVPARMTAVVAWSTVGPGLALLAVWLAGALRLRRVLRFGDAAIAVPLGVRRVGPSIPTMLEVHFRFRDHRATVREGWHRVPARGELGQYLLVARDRPDGHADRTLWRPGRGLTDLPEVEWSTERASDLRGWS